MKKHFFKSIILLTLFALSASAQDRVSLANGRVSFTPPDGFRSLTASEIELKYPRGNAPQYVYANERMSVSIAVTFSSQQLTMDALPQLKAALEQSLPRLVPGLAWVTREIVDINGRPWVHFELTSSAVDTDIHNEMFFTAFEGKMLGFNFNSTKALREQYKESLKKSKDTLRVSE